MTSERVQRQVDRLLDEAEEAVSQLNWSVVHDRAKAVLAFDPDDLDARAFLAAAERALDAPSRQDVSPQPGLTVAEEAPPQAPEPLPTFFKDGRYVVKGLLGEGATKKVYLVNDTLLEREVAFALIKTQYLDEVGRQRILREAQAAGRLGDHPNIVQLYELGDLSGHPYMVLPVMTGGSVATLIDEASDHRLPLDKAISIAKDVCRGWSSCIPMA